MASRGSYPHPVLDNSDDVSGDFYVSKAYVTPGAEFVDLQFDTRVENTEFAALLTDGSITLRGRWKCSATFTSGALDLDISPISNGSLECHATLDQEDLDGRVDVTLYLVAASPVELNLASQHDDYDGATFGVSRGDVVGHAGTFSFDARKSYDPMRPPLESCFRFSQKSNKTPFIEIDSSLDDYVTVNVPQAQYQQFRDQEAMPEVQMATVVLPALVQALVYCSQDQDPEVGGWKAALRNLCDRYGVTGRDPLVQAQAILGDPIATGFGRLSLLLEDEEIN